MSTYKYSHSNKPINKFGNSSISKIDTSLFVQKPYLRSNYFESKIEENFDLKNQFRIEILPDPISIGEPTPKNYVYIIFKSDIDFNDVKLENIKCVKVIFQPAVNEHLTPQVYVDRAIDEMSLVRNTQDNDFNNNNLTNKNGITLDFQAVNDNEVITKAFIDHFHQQN